MKQAILDMESYAKENNIPIMQKEGIAFLMKYIKANNIKNILEIGSAIGYSAILMASSNNDVKVTTIERDETCYLECLKNVKKCPSFLATVETQIYSEISSYTSKSDKDQQNI